MKHYQVLEYNKFFKLIYKFPQHGTINRTHTFVAEILDGRTVGLRLRYHIGKINLMMFKKGETKNVRTTKINNIYVIDAFSCRGLSPQNQWDIWSKW